jgi:hypothetical protein
MKVMTFSQGCGNEATVTTEQPVEKTGRRLRLTPRAQTHIAQIIVGLFGAVTALMSLQLKLWVSFGPGPGFFPFAMGMLLVLLALLWVVETRRVGFNVAESVSRVRVVSVIASLLVLVALMEPIGFQISMALFLFFHLRVIGRQGWIMTIVVTALGSFGAFALFNNVLGVRLPVAALPFLQNLGL